MVLALVASGGFTSYHKDCEGGDADVTKIRKSSKNVKVEIYWRVEHVWFVSKTNKLFNPCIT